MYWFPDEGFWWDYSKLEDESSPRHWNAFGLDEPAGDSTSLSIACEINFPLSDGTWSVAGAFAEDEHGEVYIVHSGKIGGGREGVGRSAFVEHYTSFWEWVAGDPLERNGEPKDVVVSALDDDSLVSNLAHFVKEVHRIKELAVSGESPKPPNGYDREFGGLRRPYSVKSEIRANVEHDRIVHSLYELAKKAELDVWNNQKTDLLLRGRGIALVEVKTGDDPYSRYTAIGQLLYHSKNNNALIAVFPSIESSFKKTLKRLGIEGVTWRRDGNGYVFDPRLPSMLTRL